jgi:phosphoglycolate phosphatase
MSQTATKQYTFVIFDWDGTLMDSTARIISCMQTTAKLAMLPIPTDAQVKSIIGLSMDTVLEIIFPTASKEEKIKLTDIYREQYIHLDTTPTPLFKGTLSLLSWLKEQGVLLAVATGKARVGLNRALQSVDMLNYFEYSICADEAESKPSAEMVNRLLQQTGKSAVETLMVGDSIHDLGMATNAGVDSVGVTCGASSYDELMTHSPVKILEEVIQMKSLFR